VLFEDAMPFIVRFSHFTSFPNLPDRSLYEQWWHAFKMNPR